MKTHQHKNRRRSNRSGVVAVESALIIPIIFLSVFAGIEFVRLNIIRHTIKNASYEAARAAIVPGAQEENAIEIANQILRVSGIRDATVTITPNQISEGTTFVSATINVPVNSNSWGLGIFLSGMNMSADTTLRTERAPSIQAVAIQELTHPEPEPDPSPDPDPDPSPDPDPDPNPDPEPDPDPSPPPYLL